MHYIINGSRQTEPALSWRTYVPAEEFQTMFPPASHERPGAGKQLPWTTAAHETRRSHAAQNNGRRSLPAVSITKQTAKRRRAYFEDVTT